MTTVNDPAIVLNAAIAAAAKAAAGAPVSPSSEPPAVVPHDSIAVIDPDYAEPTTIQEYSARVTAAIDLCFGSNADMTDSNRPLVDLISDLINRLIALETVMLPLAIQASLMANAQMNLIAAQRGGEAAGGTWVSKMDKIQVYPNAPLFWDLCDVLGRKHVEDHMAAIFKVVQERVAEQAAKNKFVEKGGTVQ